MSLQTIILLSFVVQGLSFSTKDSGVSEWKEAETRVLRNTLSLHETHSCIHYGTEAIAQEIREMIFLITDNLMLPNKHFIFKTTMAILREYCVFVSTFSKKKSDIDNKCLVNGTDIYTETFET